MATATSSSSPALETVRILLLSQVFHPTVGGIQSVSRVLAEEFLNLGHDVAVATRTPSTEPDGTSYEIVRQPSILQLLRLAGVRTYGAASAAWGGLRRQGAPRCGTGESPHAGVQRRASSKLAGAID